MTLPAKLGTGAIALGSATTASCLGIVYLRQGTAIDKLIEEKFEHILLNTEATGDKDTEYWKTNWESYKAESQKHATDIFGLKNWNKSNPTDLTPALKEKCKELSKTNVYDTNDSLYQKVTTYCARSVTIADEAGKNSLKEVDISGDKDDQTIWKSRIEKKGELRAELKLLSIEESNIDASKLKEGCKAAKAKKKQEQNYSNIYDAYKKVCTKQANEQ